jgi:M6 family metalloprotease-like protein
MRFKHIFLSIAAGFLLGSFSVFAAWIDYSPQTVVQPDGTTLELFGTGDEFYNWLHDAAGYTIVQNHQDGFYYYATLEAGGLIPSGWRAGDVDPSAVGLTPWTNIDSERMASFRERFYQNQMPARPALPGYKASESIQNEGTLNNLVVYIRFSDQSEYTADTAYYYNMYNNNNSGYNSMYNYFNLVSYGQLEIPSWFYPIPEGPTVISYQDIYPRGYFMPWDPVTNPNGYQSGQNANREHGLLNRACEFIEEQVPDNMIIDKDNDGYIDNMVFVVRGGTTAWGTLLWPHRWVLYTQNVFINGKKVWDYNLQIEDHLNSQGAGVLCHEMFHSLSAPDLYHYNSSSYTSVGPWDLMDNAQNPPQSMGAYMKYRYGGWIDDIPEITECGTYTLNPLSEPENNTFKIASPNSFSQYYVLEYRVKEGTFEGMVPGTGLVVYRIDLAQNGNGNAQGPPDEVYVYRPDGTPNVNGNLNLAHFGADYGRTEINDNTNPAPFLQNGQPGGLNIGNIGFIGNTISFEVFFESAPNPEFSASETTATPGCAIDFYDFSTCTVDSWLWTFEGATPGTSTEQHPEGITWANPGTYAVSLEVENPWGQNTISKSGFITITEDLVPEVSFFASDTVCCTGQTISLNDFSTVCPEVWSWSITPNTFDYVNGSNANSQNIEVVFNEPGTYTVELTATNSNGSNVQEKQDYIVAGGLPLPFNEDFEQGWMENRGWTIENPDEEITWEIFNVGGNEGEKAAGINLFNYFSIFERDRLISPPLDLSNTNEAHLMFQHAYAQSSNVQYTDSLIVKITTDCGNSWTRILELGEDGSMNFATHVPFAYSFVPLTEDDWCGTPVNGPCNIVDISPWTGNSDVRIMFESARLTGNNLYIDNVSVTLTTATSEASIQKTKDVRIFPNPAGDRVTVELPEETFFNRIQLVNLHGQVVLQRELSAGETTLSLDLEELPGGIYFVSLEGAGERIQSKLILQ